jgi:hypothetical protein
MSGDLWVAGSYPNSAMVEHRDRERWIRMQGDRLDLKPLQADSLLTSIVALSPDDVWAVGSATPYVVAGSRGPTMPLVEHWDGRRWHRIAVESPTVTESDGVRHGQDNGPD